MAMAAALEPAVEHKRYDNIIVSRNPPVVALMTPRRKLIFSLSRITLYGVALFKTRSSLLTLV